MPFTERQWTLPERNRSWRQPIFHLTAPMLLLCLLAAVVSTSGCGNADAKVDGPLGTALSYLPKQAQLVVVVPTLDRGPLKELDDLAEGSREWQRFKRKLKRGIEQDLDFETEVRPQLGNPLVYAMGHGEKDEYGVLEVKDAKQLRRLLERSIARGDETRLSSYKGALMTKDRDESDDDMNYTAIYEKVLLSADRPRQLRKAINRSTGTENLAAGSGLGETVSELDENTVFRIAGDAGRLIRTSRNHQLRRVRKIPWVRSFGEFTVLGKVKDDALALEGKLATNRGHLSESQLPIATGSEPALLHRRQALSVLGLREPAALLHFIEGALKAANPKAFRRLIAALERVRNRSGVSLDAEVIAKIRNVSVAALGGLTYQADLVPGSGRSVARALSRSKRFAEAFLQDSMPGAQVRETGGGRRRAWTVKRNGRLIGRYAVRGDTLVATRGTLSLRRPVRTRAVGWAKGALFFGMDFSESARVFSRLGINDSLSASDKRQLSILRSLGRAELAFQAEPDIFSMEGRVYPPGSSRK